MPTLKIYGSPGSGKTQTMLRQMIEVVQAGTPLEQIAWISFSKAAVREAIERTMTHLKIPSKRCEWFRTQHAMNFRLLNFQRDRIANGKLPLFVVWAKETMERTYRFSPQLLQSATRVDLDDAASAQYLTDAQRRAEFLGDTCLDAYETQRRECRTTEETAWSLRELKEYYTFFVDAYETWCSQTGYRDFTGLVVDGYAQRLVPPVVWMFVDEFQDCSPLLVAQIRFWQSVIPNLVIAGDDDQAIFTHVSGDPKLFLNFSATAQQVLGTSYRLSDSILSYAQRIITKNIVRQPKHIQPSHEKGFVFHLPSLTNAALKVQHCCLTYPNATVFFLTRTKHIRDRVIEELQEHYGFPVGFHREHFTAWSFMVAGPLETVSVTDLRLLLTPHFPSKSLRPYWELGAKKKLEKRLAAGTLSLIPYTELRDLGMTSAFFTDHAERTPAYLSGISEDEHRAFAYAKRQWPTQTPSIEVSTIHASKGREADIVVVLPDIPFAVEETLDIEAERRVWYVAVTRAKKLLFIVESPFISALQTPHLPSV